MAEFNLTDKQILGLIPAQAILDFDRAREVLQGVWDAATAAAVAENGEAIQNAVVGDREEQARVFAEWAYHLTYGYDVVWGHTGTVDDERWRRQEQELLRQARELIADLRFVQLDPDQTARR